MSISNLLVPNNYDIFANQFTVNSLDIAGNLDVQGNFVSGPGKTVTLANDTVDFTGSTVNLNLAQLTDVSITGPTVNQILRYNGTKWQNNSAIASGNWTPVLTPGPSNVGTIVLQNAIFTQVGNIVICSIAYTVQLTLAGVFTVVEFDLPSDPLNNFTTNQQIIGNGTMDDTNLADPYYAAYVVSKIGIKHGLVMQPPVGFNGNPIIVNVQFQYSLI